MARSRDGRKYIAYSRIADEGGEPHIWVMKANGTGAKRLTTGPQADTGVTWGP
jgi:Tol biopolymer transport system component